MNMTKIGEFAVALVVAFWKAFVLTIIWGWFIVPLGVPAIGVLHAYGLLLFTSLVTFSVTRHKELETIDFTERLMFGALYPAIALAVAGVLNFFM